MGGLSISTSSPGRRKRSGEMFPHEVKKFALKKIRFAMKTSGFELLEQIPQASVVPEIRGSRKAKQKQKQKKAQSGFKLLADSILSQSVGSKVLHYQSIAFFKEDLQLLLPGNWLNDNNIALIYEWISHNHLPEKISLVFPSIVQILVHFPVLDDIASLIPTKNTDYIFLPLNDTENFEESDLEAANTGEHWLLCVYSCRSSRLYVYDSADDTNDELLTALAKRIEIGTKTRKVQITKMECDQQPNEDDCGVYVMMITCALINKLNEQIENNETLLLDILNLKFDANAARMYMMNLIKQLQDR